MDRAQLRNVCEALPLFPLPRVVLMPRDVLPLHVFEPRYRALVAHLLQGDGFLGIATLQPGFDAMSARAPIFPDIGLGALASYQPMADGRSNIVVEFVARVHVTGEVPSGRPFRLVRGELREDVDDVAAGAFDALRALVVQMGAGSEGSAEEAMRVAGLDGPAMLDEIARRLLGDPDDRRTYLGLDRISERIRLVHDRLGDLLSFARPPIAEA